MFVNHAALAPTVIALWKKGGGDSLVKVAPLGTVPDPRRPAGICTTLKFVVGRTPAQMEAILGLAPDSTFGAGADIFAVAPLPSADEFEMKGYSPSPDGLPVEPEAGVLHPLYPPGLGAPQWKVAAPQSRLALLARVPRGEIFSFEVRRLPPLA
jgi:hypothetical protein